MSATVETVTIELGVTRKLIDALESGGDCAIKVGWTETAVTLYGVALRLRTETGFHPLRRADDDRPVT